MCFWEMRGFQPRTSFPLLTPFVAPHVWRIWKKLQRQIYADTKSPDHNEHKDRNTAHKKLPLENCMHIIIFDMKVLYGMKHL